MRCYNKTESLLYSKYIFSVITMYTIDFGNFNMDTHVKGITNRASPHSHEPFLIRAPSTLQERWFSIEEVRSYVVHCFYFRWNNAVLGCVMVTEWSHFKINTHPCYREWHCSVHTQEGGTTPPPTPC